MADLKVKHSYQHDDQTKNGNNMEMASDDKSNIEQLSPVNNRKASVNAKLKSRRNRELEELEENEILPTRLRSVSGRVYSTSMVIDHTNKLDAVGEEGTLDDEESLCEEQQQQEDSTENTEMLSTCSDSGCCKNSATIVRMISRLQKSVDSIKSENIRQTNLNLKHDRILENLDERCEAVEEDIQTITDELKECKFQLKLVSNVVIRQDQQIAALNRKLNDAQTREMYPNIIISGIEETAMENPIQQFNSFVTTQLGIQELIPANRAYRMGTGKSRPLLVELRDPITYKPKIYGKVGNLKGKKNSQGARYFVSDHLPEEYNERRRRANDIIAENKRKPPATKENMSVKRGRLLINEKEYRKAVQAPLPAEILYPDEKMYDLAEEIDMVKSKEETVGNSYFVAYAAAVHTHKDIQAAYTKVRMKYANATHISCAFRLPGSDTYFKQDYIDDGEHGAGRTMLGVIKETALMNVVVFMIRFYGGTNLGPMRFEVFKKVTKSAIINMQTRIKQQEAEEAAEKAAKAAAELQRNLQPDAWPSTTPPTEDWSNEQQETSDKKTA